ncbi:hypothetical protein Tco_0226767 [Tanacetum coccineum]
MAGFHIGKGVQDCIVFRKCSLDFVVGKVSPVDINPINSSVDKEGKTIVVGCKNDASIQKSNGLATLEKEIKTRWTPMNASVLKFNQLVQETAVHRGENDDDHINRFLGTDEEPEHFEDDDLPRPPGLQRLAKSQRTGSNSTASSGSNPAAYQEFMAKQYELDRKAKMTVLERESEDRRRLIQSQRIAEDMRVLQIDTRGMDAADAAIINAQKARI